MTFQQFRFGYKSFLIILNLLSFLIIGLFIWNSYHYFKYNDLADYLSSLQTIEHNSDKLWQIFKPWLIELGIIILKIFSLVFISFVFKRIPLKASWIIQWDNAGEINSVLGRYMTSHLRWHSYINFQDLLYFYQLSLVQVGWLYYHNKKGTIVPLFEKYDPHYLKDKSDI